jgi:hypothetical protein
MRASVRAERTADCPFSVAQSYAEEFLAAAERGEPEAIVRAGPAHLAVRFGFEARTDVLERGRIHDEIAVHWTAHSPLLPDFAGTLRFRIAGTRTRFILEGTYVPPGGVFGALFDRVAGRRIAQATAVDLVTQIAARAAAREAAWRVGIMGPQRGHGADR